MILENEKIKQALEYIKEEDPATTQDTLNMCQIPAPSYKEEKKAEYIRERFWEIGLRDVRIDAVGNVLGIWPGTGEGPSVMLAAHTDTVFPEGTDLSIRKEGNRYYCPGINDDTHAVAEMIAVAKAMIHADLHTKGDLIFCANVCEEGLGDLRGVKYLFGYDNKASEECPEVDAFVSIDNQYTGGVIYTATGSHRYEVTFTGRGGHSFQNFGIPNPIHAMGRAIAQIAEFQVPNEPKTTFNVGVIQGGTSVNTISGSASMLVDLRSDSEEELNLLDEELHKVIKQAVEEENARWDASKPQIKVQIEGRGVRPAGAQPKDCAIVKAAFRAAELLGIEPEYRYESSTDANIPISMGIPAITVGRGGEEAIYLADHGIYCEVVPGISSCIAAAELAGIPVTHRGISKGFRVVTAHDSACRSRRSL